MESVHYFVRGLFRGITESRAVTEQREELESHLNDRIADLVSGGMSQDAALTSAIDSMGNLDELVETIIGNKKKIYANKLQLFTQLVSFAYGLLYLAASGFWFYQIGFGSQAYLIIIPGLLSYGISVTAALISFLRFPHRIEAVETNRTQRIRAALSGWLVISVSCFVVNFLFAQSDTFLQVFWSWMPFAGIFTWPLTEITNWWMVASLSAIKSE